MSEETPTIEAPRSEGPHRFKPGQSGNLAGRPKKLVRRIEEVLHAAGIDPMQEVMKLIQDPLMTSHTKLKTWLELFPYIYPKAREEQSAADNVRDTLAALSNGELVARLEKDLQTLKKSA